MPSAVFVNTTFKEQMLSKVDEVEKILMELKRSIECYLPKKLGLLVVYITTTLVEVLKSSFVGSQVIVLDDLIN